MIRKLRRQFIVVAMLSTFLVLFVIIGAINVANYTSVLKRADAVINLLADNDGSFPDFFMGRRVDFGDRKQGLPEMELLTPGAQESGNTEQTTPGAQDSKMEQATPGAQDSGMAEQVAPGAQDPEMAEPMPPRNMGFIGMNPAEFFSNETPYETRFFSVHYNSSWENQYIADTGRIISVTDEKATDYAKVAIEALQKRNKERGFQDTYRYYATTDAMGGYLVVFVDMTKELNTFHNVLRYSLILSGVGLLAVFILVWFFSKKVFRPVEESYQKQRRFVTDVSHELKTPLTIISANVDVLEMENEENTWTKSIQKQISRMNGLVEKMVTLSRLDENSELTLQEFSMSQAMEETAGAYIPVAEKNGQDLKIEITPNIMIHADESKIRQMAGLLIENATKYATAPSKERKPVIKVSFGTKGKKAILKVRNTCDTTQIDETDKLFERFYRPDNSRNSKKGGSGIGLSIVKAIAEAHNGQAVAKNISQEEIEFEISLPLK